ncbi:Serine hydrolase-like protein, partial [Operophtera brumata]
MPRRLSHGGLNQKVFTSLKTPTLNIVSRESHKKGLYRNTAFLLDEAIYPAGNYRCRMVDGAHDVHITSPHDVA